MNVIQYICGKITLHKYLVKRGDKESNRKCKYCGLKMYRYTGGK